MAFLRDVYVHFHPFEGMESIPHVVDFFTYELCPLRSDRIRCLKLIFASSMRGFLENDDGDIAILYRQPFENNYLATPKGEREKFILDLLHRELIDLSTRYGLEQKKIDEAAAVVVESGYIFDKRWGKACYSPTREYKAEVCVKYPRDIELHLRIISGSNVIQSELLSVGTAGFASIKEAYSKMQWTGEHELRVFTGNARDFWNVRICEKPTFEYQRPESNDGAGEYILGRMYLEGRIVLQDLSLGEQLLTQSSKKGYKHAAKMLEKSRK